MRIATFNVQNMRLQHDGNETRLRGARDRDETGNSETGEDELDPIDRRLTAEVIRKAGADVVALQEVFDIETLDHFHDHYLLPASAGPYPFRTCLPGNDGHGYDVALLSRIPLDEALSHATLLPSDLGLTPPKGTDPDIPVFRRDCLRVRIDGLTLFVCHFKAPYPDPDLAYEIRRNEAMGVRRLIENTFPDPEAGHWMIVGDLNEPFKEPRGERAIAPLIGDFSVDLLERLPAEERWSYHLEDTEIYSRPDAMLASPALAAKYPDAKPWYLFEGLGRDARRYAGERLSGVGFHRPHASDHAALVVDLGPSPA